MEITDFSREKEMFKYLALCMSLSRHVIIDFYLINCSYQQIMSCLTSGIILRKTMIITCFNDMQGSNCLSLQDHSSSFFMCDLSGGSFVLLKSEAALCTSYFPEQSDYPFRLIMMWKKHYKELLFITCS